MRMKALCVGVLFVALYGGSEASAQECFPNCRSGYVCVNGQCVSACNPPCDAGETCTPEGECTLAQDIPPPEAPSEAPPPAWGDRASEPDAHDETVSDDGLEAEPTESQAPGASFLLSFGASFGWFIGPQIGIGGAFRLSDDIYLALRGYGGGGPSSTESGNFFAAGIGEVTVRYQKWRPVGAIAFGGAGATFLAEFEGDGYDYGYIAPHFSGGGGVLFAGSRSVAISIEATLRLGHAINFYNWYIDEGLGGTDYSGFYGALDLAVVLHF